MHFVLYSDSFQLFEKTDKAEMERIAWNEENDVTSEAIVHEWFFQGPCTVRLQTRGQGRRGRYGRYGFGHTTLWSPYN